MQTLPGVGDVCLVSVPASSLPGDDGWFTAAEAAILGRFRFSKRASDWRLGRWVAKEAAVETLKPGASSLPRLPDLAEVEVLAGPGGAPRVRILAPGNWPDVTVSLSHAGGVGFAAAALGSWRLGCDVEEVTPRSEGFVDDYLTPAEAAWVRAGGADRDARATLVWSAKESALKALGEGLRKDTRSVVVDVAALDEHRGDGGAAGMPDVAWAPLRVTTEDGEEALGWWRGGGALVWTLVCLPSAGSDRPAE